MADMLVKLFNISMPVNEEEKLLENGIRIKRALATDRSKIIEYSKGRKDEYLVYNEDIRIKSWIDYFILGDLYVLGFGYDFAEFDLWWLVNRKLKEKANCGAIYFYEPETEENRYKLLAMKDMGIHIETLNTQITADENDLNSKYDDFYNKAIADIALKIGGILNE